ncbi:Cache domain-containing protein [Formivibrio citricus]|uniref:Cache domain-containing protein n=1 Tax=Formivibrio citricus TaxID=83765 RepID=A0A1I4YQ95_9NEIS|nr:cache domain-containing protein [Formivibrio citricus]SFN40184.1 Cache domain-containing protein [Formivibrio citricus]
MALKNRLLACTVVFLMIATASLAGVAYWQIRTEIIDGVTKEISTAVRGNRETLARWMAQRRDAIEATANRLSGSASPLPFLIACKDAGRFNLTYAGYSDKKMVYHTEKKPAEGYDPTIRPWYKAAMEKKGTVATAPYIFASNNKLGITVARPFENNGIQAVVGGDITLEEIVTLVKSIELRGNGYAFLATQDGKIVAHPKPDSALKPVEEIAPGFDPAILKSAGLSISLRASEIGNRTKYVATSLVPGTDWVLCTVVDKATILTPLRSLLWILVFASLAVVLLGACIVMFNIEGEDRHVA